MLDDGTYDALVFDAGGGPADAPDGDPAGASPAGHVTVELTILDGEHKGAVVSVTTDDFVGDPLDLLGIPATLTVRDGRPSVVFEP